MPQISGTLHAVSLLRMQRVMKSLGMLPLKQVLLPKILCCVWLGFVIGLETFWRFRFDYDFGYDFLNDSFSRTVDLANFVGLMTSHLIVVIELVWLNCSDEIQTHLEGIHRDLDEYLDRQLDLERVRRYCNAVYGSIFIRVLIFSMVTVYGNRALFYYAHYSELVLLVRFSEFSLYCAVVLALYDDLIVAGSSLLEELERTRFEPWPIRQLTLNKLDRIQRIHALLWHTIRCVERNFQFSLIAVLLKYFVDTSALPYWLYLSMVEHTDVKIQYYCGTEEVVKLLEIMVPCWICTRCDGMQRKFRAMFYTVTTDRRNRQLNAALLRLCMQLGQETCQFSAGGLVEISTEMLGKFLFGVASYIVVCIQFSFNFK
ncbi:hypothetical protein KR009_004372, partial [Drosophila setifemur]